MTTNAERPLPNVGIIGVGAMGGAMATRLLDCGLRVHVHDIDPARQHHLHTQGASTHPHPGAVAQAATFLLVVVVDASQTLAVLQGPNGLLSALQAHHTVVFCSTISPEDMQQACQAVVAASASALDAPMSGGPHRARNGTLSMMLAGPCAVIEESASVLRHLNAHQFVISANVGDASKAKLVNNLVAGINLAAITEALALARHLGLNEAQMLQLMQASSAQSWIGQDRMARALQDDFAPRAQTHVLTKDLHLANRLAQAHGYPTALGTVAHQVFQSACDAGHRHEDDASLLKFRYRWRG